MTATAIQSAAMTEQEIHDWWASENGLEDCEMCNSADFHQVVRAVESRLAARSAPEALRPCGYMNFSGENTICRKCGQRHCEPIYAALAARPAPEDGWSTITVKNLWPLLDALARADNKGYMPDAMADEWAAFDYRDEPASAPEALSLPNRIAELIEQHGSLRAAARVLDCDPGYLSRLQSGEKDDPGALLLRRMGLHQITTYERTQP